MRKLLQNKAVVACLVLVAAVCLAGDTLKRLFKKSDLPVAARVVPDAVPLVPGTFPIRTSLRVATNFSNWRDWGAGTARLRDPFGSGPSVLLPTNSVAPPVAPTPPTFTVQAISIDGDRALAVINQRVVAAGDQIEGYRVEAILPDQVRLHGPAGAVTAAIYPNRQTSPIASTAK